MSPSTESSLPMECWGVMSNLLVCPCAGFFSFSKAYSHVVVLDGFGFLLLIGASAFVFFFHWKSELLVFVPRLIHLVPKLLEIKIDFLPWIRFIRVLGFIFLVDADFEVFLMIFSKEMLSKYLLEGFSWYFANILARFMAFSLSILLYWLKRSSLFCFLALGSTRPTLNMIKRTDCKYFAVSISPQNTLDWLFFSYLFRNIFSWKLTAHIFPLSLIHIWRCRRLVECRSRWSPYH